MQDKTSLKVEKLYRSILLKHGKPRGQWKLWCKKDKTEQEREEVMMGAILTQRTNWKNVELTLAQLKKEQINSLSAIYRLGLKNKERLSLLLKQSGFYKTKTNYLFGLARFIFTNYTTISRLKREKTEKLRKELMALKGVGEETADSILLYALDKPVFVIDEYTRRLVKKHEIAKDLKYESLQNLFQDNLKKDFKLYQDFHALIVIEGQTKLK